MQIKPEQLLRQQLILKFLGFYKHKLDGIWGPASIEAKRAWEQKPSFVPAYPNNGMPFGERDQLPKGMRLNKVSRVFDFVGLSETYIAESTGQQAIVTEVAPQVPVIASDAVPSPESVPTPVVETPVEPEVKVDQNQNRNNQNNRPQHHHKPR